MKKNNQFEKVMSRRELLKRAAIAAVGVAVTGCDSSGGSSNPGSDFSTTMPTGENPITIENAKPGTQDWRLTKTSTVPGLANPHRTSGRSPTIEGYCAANSVRAGENLQIMVSTNPASNFKLEIFRTGYYNGDGGRLIKTYDSLVGITQTDPVIGAGYVRECQWQPSLEFEIPEDWLSGVYLGKLTAEASGNQSYVIFIVRDDRDCDLLFQCSDLTWSAYNMWPTDYSIYSEHTPDWSSTAVPSGTVSFDRPYALFTHPVNPLTDSVGSGEFLPWEFPLSYWLEQHGYDVSYISSIDTHGDRNGLLRTKGFISVGHDEYWSSEMYGNVLYARDAGVSLAFLCGNSVFGHAPLYSSADGRPNRVTRREGWFYGLEAASIVSDSMINENGFNPNMGPDAALLMGARTPAPPAEAIGAGNWTCATPNHWLFNGTGMQEGDSIDGLVGWEMHAEPALDLLGMQIVGAGGTTINGGSPGTYTATIYNGPQGNIVFNAATIWWANGLSSPPGHIHPTRHGVTHQGPDARVQQITHNLFNRMINGQS